MRVSIAASGKGFVRLWHPARGGALLLLAAGLLAGCETTGTGPGATGAPSAQSAPAPKAAEAAEAGKPSEPAKPAEAAKPAETAKPAQAAKPAAAAKPAEAPKPAATAKPAEPAEPAEPEPPMTRARAARECWMKTEKGSARIDLDKRADIVTKCIEDKLNAAKDAAPRP
jgi:outer membrane biosynthesis protein TonB